MVSLALDGFPVNRLFLLKSNLLLLDHLALLLFQQLGLVDLLGENPLPHDLQLRLLPVLLTELFHVVECGNFLIQRQLISDSLALFGLFLGVFDLDVVLPPLLDLFHGLGAILLLLGVNLVLLALLLDYLPVHFFGFCVGGVHAGCILLLLLDELITHAILSLLCVNLGLLSLLELNEHVILVKRGPLINFVLKPADHCDSVVGHDTGLGFARRGEVPGDAIPDLQGL